MRKHYLLYASAAMIALASCSRETVEVITPEMSTSYAKISISMASAPGTRADWGDEGKFDNGSEDESRMTLDDIHLVFYDESGIVVGTGKHKQTSLSDNFTLDREGTNGISDENTAVFELTLFEGAPLPAKVAAFINTPAMTFNLDKIGDIGTNVSEVYKTDGKFIMTSAGYYSGSEYVVTADVDKVNGIHATVDVATAATTPTAEIYVERLAAKVNLTAKDPDQSSDEQRFIIQTPDGKRLIPTFDITNWGITGTADKMYMLKQPFDYNNNDEKLAWMNGTNRSYWAKGAYWNEEYENYSKTLAYLPFSGIKGELGTADYTLEHTYDYETLVFTPLFSEKVTSTSTIVLGKYSFDSEEEVDMNSLNKEIEEGGGFYLLNTGGGTNGEGEDAPTVSVWTLYTKAQLIEYLKKNFKHFYDTDGNDVADFDIVKSGTQFKLVDAEWAKKYEADETYKTTLYTAKDEETGEVSNPVPNTNARHYVGSQGYFFVPIEHYTQDNAEKNGYYGVVRNHSYELTISAIYGLAAPLDDKYTDGVDPEDPDYPGGEEEPIIPDPDDLKEAYIQASIKVLSWHVVSQDVKL